MKFRTELNKYERYNFIDYSSRILLLGSCFAENVFNYLDFRKYQVFINPCGISFNPISISNSFDYLIGDKVLKEEEISSNRGHFFHYDFHGRFNDVSSQKCYDNIRTHLDEGRGFVMADTVIISLGTAFIYALKNDDRIINNCHKVPQAEFLKKLLTTKQIISSLESLVKKIYANNQDARIIFTVSPVRHLKDGMVENNWSKSSLILAVKAIREIYKNVLYFPSYEIVLDDLRDYRFYAKDRIHPNEDAVEYIMQFFEKHFLDVHEKEIREKVLSIQKRLSHKAFRPNSQEHQDFLKKLKAEMISLQSVTKLDFSIEINDIREKII